MSDRTIPVRIHDDRTIPVRIHDNLVVWYTQAEYDRAWAGVDTDALFAFDGWGHGRMRVIDCPVCGNWILTFGPPTCTCDWPAWPEAVGCEQHRTRGKQ